MKKNIGILLALIAISIGFVFANPADTTMKTQIQKDKRVLDFYLFGDEWVNWAKTTDGYTLVLNENGEYCYAYQDAEQKLRASNFIATNPSERTAEENAFLRTISKGLKYSTNQIIETRSKVEISLKAYPTTGSNNLLVILVEFPDRLFTYTQTEFQNLMSQPGYSVDGSTGSVKEYFHDCSMGQLNLNPTVVGPVTMSHEMAYYGAPGPSFVDMNPKAMVSEACALVDSQIDFTQFDMDNDGYIDAVHIIFAGAPQSRTGEVNAIWPHRWAVTEYDDVARVFDGKTLGDYSCSGEKRAALMDGVGTICHEFGHVLGLPDFYDTDYEETGGDAPALSQWSVMASGSYNNNGNTPAGFNANERYKLGWLSLDTLTIADNYSLPSLIDSNKAYVITTPYENEYFILENRLQTSWDEHIPASGMLIYHIKDEGDYCINCNPSYQRCDIEEADRSESSNTLGTDVFPNPQSNNFFTDYASPNSKLWSGESLNKPVNQITRDTADGMIYFNFMIPDSAAVIGTLNNRETISTISIKLNGVEYYEGLYDYTIKGFAIDTQSNFSTQSFFSANIHNGDTFALVANNLNYATDYWYRAAYVSAIDTVYGNVYNFRTGDGQPILRTINASNVGLTSFTAGGKKLQDGDFPILEYGIYYDTIQNLDSTSNVISFQGELTEFSVNIENLEQATKYYYVAYCKTALGVKKATRSYVTTSFVPIENNEIAAELSGCEGDSFGTIEGQTPTAGQGNFTYLWQKKTSSTSWQAADNENTNKDYLVGVLTEPTSFRRIVYSYAIKDTSNVVNVEVKQSKGGKITAKSDWISSETDTLMLKNHVGNIIQWEHAPDTLNWSVITASPDTSIAYKPAYIDTMYLRTMVRLEQCPEAYSQVLKIYVLHDVSLSEIKPEQTYLVYPNPAKEYVEVQNPKNERLSLELYDTGSRLVFSDKNVSSSYKLRVSDFLTGVYMLRITNLENGSVYNVKLIITK